MTKKAVMISIQPYWVFLIIAKTMGWNVEKEKTVEVRKNFPKDENWDKTVKIYCSKDKKSFNRIPKEYQPAMKQFLGKVIGEFVCDEITKFSFDEKYDNLTLVDMSWKSCLSKDEIADYANGQYIIFGWQISNLVVYNEPRGLCDFRLYYGTAYFDKEIGYPMPTHEITRPPQNWYYIEVVA